MCFTGTFRVFWVMLCEFWLENSTELNVNGFPYTLVQKNLVLISYLLCFEAFRKFNSFQ